MKRLFTLILTVLICILYNILSKELCEAKTVLYLNECGTVLDVFNSVDENIYVLSEFNNNYKIIEIHSDFHIEERVIDINVNSSTYAYANNTFYFFSEDNELENDIPMPEIIIDSYNCESSVRHKRVINNAYIDLNVTLAVDSNENYYITYNGNIDVYSSKYKYLRNVTEESNIANLSNSSDGKIIFCSCANNLIIICNDTEYYFDINSDKIYSGKDYYFTSSNGIVYRFNNGEVYEVYSGFDGSHGSAVVGEWIFGCKNSELIAVNLNNNKEVYVGNVDSNAFICFFKDRCLCITQSGNGADVEIFTEADLKESEPVESSSITNKNESEALDSDDNKANVYKIDYSKNTLTGIKPGSTVAQVRDNMQGDTFIFYDSEGYIKTSGKVGTGNYIENIDTKKRLYVIIYGELNGEGTINLSDKKSLVNHLLKKDVLDGFYYKAADVNNDLKVNLKDYILLDNYLKGEYEINQSR